MTPSPLIFRCEANPRNGLGLRDGGLCETPSKQRVRFFYDAAKFGCVVEVVDIRVVARAGSNSRQFGDERCRFGA